MTTQQPEALRLADELEKCWADPGLQIRSAAELRRLHAENTHLQLTELAALVAAKGRAMTATNTEETA